MNSTARLFLVVLTIGPLLGLMFLTFFRWRRASRSSAERLETSAAIRTTEVAELPKETPLPDGSRDDSFRSNDPRPLPEVEPHSPERDARHLEADRRFRTQLMDLRQAEEDQRRRIDAATRRRKAQRSDETSLAKTSVNECSISSGQQLPSNAPYGDGLTGQAAIQSSSVAVLDWPEDESLNREDSAVPQRSEDRVEVAFRSITEAFDDLEPETRNAAALALYDFQSDPTASFTRALRESSPERRRRIGEAVASSGLAAKALSELTHENHEDFDAFSLLFLMIKAGEIEPLIRTIEESQNNDVRIAVVKLMALSGESEIIPAFRRLAVRVSLPVEVRSAVMVAIDQLSSVKKQTSTRAV
ncbi:MAG TPA: hypothetical protein VIV66_10770 [Pyrinomonadaceae bacterium]